MVEVDRVPLENVPWQDLDSYEDRNIFQTLPWLNFIMAGHGGEPVIAQITENGRLQGYFTGLKVAKFGIKILGSPFKGWTTGSMGFNLLPGTDRGKVLRATQDFAFRKLNCLYFEMMDRFGTCEDYSHVSQKVSPYRCQELDLTRSEEELWSNMSSKSCRWCIRKAKKIGLTIEEASDEQFADDYYEQLTDVFAKQSLIPTYDLQRVRDLIKFLKPTGNLLLLRVREPTGKCIATGIFPGFHDTGHFWGGASWRKHQNFCPNEFMIWHAMIYWKRKGMKTFNLGGYREYKRKFGVSDVSVPRVICARTSVLVPLRDVALQAWNYTHRFRGHVNMLAKRVLSC
ncbi:MAG: GNAT family N-acetyltransferase [Desulfomonile tiedjei]|uniref:GNAT family N-acetyltransferase n=1 Tax=Desulfomonile tiedjei TaxID=2358 RepID=A0A9D6V4K9_9BACT|nr:GNAT family N-acetyltransferase [Desulfomonile tiedjei]